MENIYILQFPTFQSSQETYTTHPAFHSVSNFKNHTRNQGLFEHHPNTAKMLGAQSFLLYALAGLSATTAHVLPRENRAHPSPKASPAVVPSQTDCIVPDIGLAGLEAPFTLSTFVEGFETYPLSLPAKHSPYGDQPFITTPASKSKALFRLKDGKLTTGGPNHDQYSAYFGPVEPIFPNPPAPLLFGDVDDGLRFNGGYACGPGGGLVLVLNTYPRKLIGFSRCYEQLLVSCLHESFPCR